MSVDSQVILKVKKCCHFEDGIDYLGHGIQPGALGISTKAMDAIDGVRHPTSVSE